ncbi:MAG: hypothetical protein EOO92_15115 [Pedobacter sp.]|nr:MAG: hypothetical protein EOO92_15115 [Pedobacter sp.]
MLLKNRIYVQIIFLICCQLSLLAQTQQRSQIDTLLKSVNSHYSNLQIERFFLHTDRDAYLASDTIWFKGYLFNAADLTASTKSSVAYMELADASNQVLKRVRLPVAYGVTYGNLALADNLPAGDYELRLYTNWMKNFGEQVMFKKRIAVHPPVLGALQRSQDLSKKKPSSNRNIKHVKSTGYKASGVNVAFKPEGGSFILGQATNIAFKVTDKNGNGIDVIGEVVNKSGQRVVDIPPTHHGIGSFNMISFAKESYKARLTLPDSTVYTVDLPAVQANGTSLKVISSFNRDSCEVIITASEELRAANQNYYVIGHSRGMVCFGAAINFKNGGARLKVSKKLFPTGISHILLTTGAKKVLNERLVYIDHQDQLRVSVLADKSAYNLRDSVGLSIKVTDAQGLPVKASLSLAVTDDDQVEQDSLSGRSILRSVLFSGELNGAIEDPGYYVMASANQKVQDDLDNLLLAQGRTFYGLDVPEKMNYFAETEFLMQGTVKNAFNKPIAGLSVRLMSKKPLQLLDTVTNGDGVFQFKNIIPLDTPSYFIQGLNKKGKLANVTLEMDDFQPQKFSAITVAGETFGLPADTSLKSEALREYERKRGAYLSNQPNMLREVSIVGKKIIKGSKNLNGAGEADVTIDEATLMQAGKMKLGDLLYKNVKGFGVRATKTGSMYFHINNIAVHLIIDGLIIDFFLPEGKSFYEHYREYMDYYDASEIKGVEVMLKGKYQLNYHRAFMNPMDIFYEHVFLEVTTRGGVGPFLKKSYGSVVHRPLPFALPATFYSPSYSGLSDVKTDFRPLIHWEPNIVTDENGNATVKFFTSDNNGKYSIAIKHRINCDRIGILRSRCLPI